MWERLQKQQRDLKVEREKDRRRFEKTMWRYNRMTERRFRRANRRLVIIGIILGSIFTALQIIIPLIVNRESAIDRLIRQLFGHVSGN
jgi:hypothetical protein